MRSPGVDLPQRSNPYDGFGHSSEFYIGGRWVTPSGNTFFEVADGTTETCQGRFAEALEADARRAVAAARHAFDKGVWPRLSHAERASFLEAIGREMERQADDTAAIWSIESGITYATAKAICGQTRGIYDHYAGLVSSFPFVESHQPGPGSGKPAYLVREPVGVVVAIIPWNAPEIIIPHKVAPALLAGCTVIVKASPEAPGAAHALALACQRAGLPEGVVNVLTADREVSELLIRNPDVDKVTFTGSTVAGRRIAAICGERVARCTLELGGKSAALILDDYDVEKAARTLSRSARVLSGQACAALTRIIVPQRRHDAMIEALAASFGQLKVGDPFDAETEMGPLASERQRERVEGYIARGLVENAQLAAGGGRPLHLDRGYFVEPTIFGRVDNNSTIAREEIFGPVLCVIPARNEEDAVNLANDSIYGLNASVFTNDLERAWQISRRLRCGTVGHNAMRIDQAISFGGFKQSGIGREGGKEGLSTFLEAKTVLLEAEYTV